MRQTLLSAAADLLTGFAALALFVVADNFLHVGADLRGGLVSLAVLCLAAGFLRGRTRPRNAWWKGLLVCAGASLPLLALGWDSIPPVILAMLLLVANLFAVCGVRARRLWQVSARRGWLALAVPFAALALVALAAVPALTIRTAIRKTFAPARAFSISTPDGATIASSSLRGRVAVLSFWATWCPPCRRELPELEKLYRQYRGNANVVFWAVDSLKNGDTVAKARDYLAKQGYTLPVAFDREKCSEALGVEALPSLLLIDKSGRIRLVHTGYDGSERLQSELSGEIDRLLAERF